MTARRRRAAALAALPVLALATTAAGCDTRAQFAPTLPAAAGHRMVDGDLRLWTGTPCTGVTRVRITFDQPGTDKDTRLTLTAPAPGVRLKRLDLGNPGPRFTVSEALPDGFDWRQADTVSVVTQGENSYWSSAADIATIVEESPEQPAGTYLFGDDVGWLDAEGVRAKNGQEFLTICTPDPAKQ